MRTTSAELKLRARRSLLGRYVVSTGGLLTNYGILIACVLVLEIILFAFIFIGMVADGSFQSDMHMIMTICIFLALYLIIMLLQYMMLPGILRLYLNISRHDNARVSDIFFAFRNRPGKFFKIAFLVLLAVFILMIPTIVLSIATSLSGEVAFHIVFSMLYMLLLWVISLYLGLNYGQFFLIITEDPEKGILDALKESRRLMRGNRWRFVLLQLSFIGWGLMTYMTMGIAMLWLIPYMICTNIQFYLDLKPREEVIQLEVLE